MVISGPATTEDNSVFDASRAVSATNTLPGSTEQYLTSDTRKEVRSSKTGATADYGLLKVSFATDASSSRPVVIAMPDGKTVSFRATFLVLRDRSSDTSYLLGQVTNCTGEIVSASDVLFHGAFDTINADLMYRYDKNGSCLEQFVILNEDPAIPLEFKGKDQDLSLECWTEFFDQQPQSTVTQTIQLRPASALAPAVEATDLTADFGLAKVLQGGKAFSVGAELDVLPVGKAWQKSSRQHWHLTLPRGQDVS